MYRAQLKVSLSEKLIKLEAHLNADVFSYFGPIFDGLEPAIQGLIEDLAADINKKDRLVVVLTTTGGSAVAVERYVSIIRHHYKTVDFFVPNYAYSAGTIFCMSGDNIYMDYSSVLGPIDPQVQNKDGKWVAALGYLDKVNDAILKSNSGTLSNAEFLMVKDLDLAELRSYEQAKELTIELLKKWLVKYKFKDWNEHQTTHPAKLGQPVTVEEKEERATQIAAMLNDNAHWKSHSRPINMEALRDLGLRIEDYGLDDTLKGLIRDYYDLLSDYVANNNNSPVFVQTRKII